MASILAVIGVLVSVPALGASVLVLVDDHGSPIPGGLKAMLWLEQSGISNPRDLQARSGDNSAVLTWTAPEDLNGIALEGYIIQRSIDGRAWGNLTMVDAKTTKFTDIWISNGMTVIYRIVAVGGGEWSNPSNEASARPIGRPWPPVNVHTMIEGSSVVVKWSAPLYIGGSNLTSYMVFRKADADKEFKQVAQVPSGERSWFDRTVSGNASVKYYVVAQNAAGSSAPSETALASDVPSAEGPRTGASGSSYIMLIAGGVAVVAVAGIASAVWIARSRRRAEIERRMRFCQSIQYVDPKCQGTAFFTPTARHL
jgi:hypothetical protein